MRFEVVAALFLLCSSTGAFTQPGWTSTTSRPFGLDTSATWKLMSAQDTVTETSILGALRSAAMSLHTTRQAPKEGKVEVKEPQERYVPTHDDYLAFLVDSQVVYEALEEIVNSWEELSVFRDNGLERTKPLDIDIDFMVKEYDLQRPEVGSFGTDYAAELRRIREEGSIPEFMCHYYNFYFAHMAGGRMIGKQMSALLLDKKTLEFYKVCNVCFWRELKQTLMRCVVGLSSGKAISMNSKIG